MADAVIARWHGDNYQARVFWENALNLLDNSSCVAEVSRTRILADSRCTDNTPARTLRTRSTGIRRTRTGNVEAVDLV